MQPKFKAGDKVVCSQSFEAQQPMEIVKIDPWFPSHRMASDLGFWYIIKATHAKKGNQMTVRIEEGLLEPYNPQ
jgi:hypothetical protein